MRFLRPDDSGEMPFAHLIGGRWRRRPWPIFAFGLILASGLVGAPTPALHGDGLLTLIGGLTIVVLIAVEARFDPQDPVAITVMHLALGGASILLTVNQASGAGIIGTYAAVAGAIIRLPRRFALIVVVPIIVAVNVLIAIWGSERLLNLAWTDLAYVFMFLVGHLVRLSEERQRQARELLEEEERTRAARNEAAALAERGRIAREMHDVLAHSLSALSVELEGARLLALDRDADPEVIAAIGRAHRHATSGLAEAREAIEALRGDVVPGPERLAELAADFEAHGGKCALEVRGEPRPLSSEAALAVFRTAQEALTNVRKHGAGADRVSVRLSYEGDGAELVVENNAPQGAAVQQPRSTALSRAGAGYGVSGMRERAELIGGRLLAGPTAAGYRVELWVPA